MIKKKRKTKKRKDKNNSNGIEKRVSRKGKITK